MPRFDFDVREGARFIPDKEGSEFDNLNAAEVAAARGAAEIGWDRCRRAIPVKLRLR